MNLDVEIFNVDSLSIYCLYRKLKHRKKERKKTEVWVKTNVEMTDGWTYMVIPNFAWSLEGRFSDVTEGVYWTFWATILYYTKCTISKFWNSITVLKLLRGYPIIWIWNLNLSLLLLRARLCCYPIYFSSNFSAFEFCYFVVAFYPSIHALAHL